ncbi:MAG: TolC family protein [Azonexus sp.]
MNKTRIAFPLLLGTAVLLSACGSLTPTPYTKGEIKDRIANDRQKMFADQEPVTGPITFHEAAARALKYNLDYRLKLMESALSRSLYDVSKFDMLPRLVANAGYAGRSNTAGGISEGIDINTGKPDGTVSLRPSTATEDNRRLAGLTLSWNVLDFGVSYYRAQQKADQILMAEERRRKVVQNVLQDVRNSYWRAVGAQRLIGEVNILIDRTGKALEAAKKAEDQGLLPRLQALSYQRALLDAVSLMNLRRQDLELARAELAALMSLPPGTPMPLADSEDPIVSTLPADTEALERMALERRPEIMEEWYRKRVTATDIKIAKAQVWPNLSLEAGPLYDSNKYLYNNNWAEVGLRLSLNLIKLLQWPALDQAQADQEQTDDTRRMGLSMAILTQVHVGKQRYELSLSELKFAEEIMRVDGRLLEYAKAAASTSVDSELEVIRAEARSLLARYQRQAAYSNAQAAWGRLYNSVGLDVMPEAIESHDVKTLAAEIKRTMGEWGSVGLRPPGTPAASKAPG